ncbi:MAG: hypothetical protein CVU03_04345 [Bacteroidetes bacterium HGW-Bacteroidetes-2]|jgi:hypothetical protein|nr:MAG: hypothetical protein CVU03_04345 [Bacteroidetes bacterium HGW-Bacteroidetes-2]
MKKIICLMLLMLPLITFSQSNYEFTATNEVYTDLVGSTSLNNGQTWDDPEFVIPLGFDFQIGTHTFSTIYIVEWSVGGILSSNPNFSGIVPIFAPISQDIIDFGFGTGNSLSNISYLTEGTSGSQIFKIEWNNVGFFDDATENDFMNFQLWLYEGSNTIEYRYGQSQINNPSGSFEGETGPVVSLLASYNLETDELEDNAFFLTGNPENPNFNIIEPGNQGFDGALVGMIPEGTTYRFVQDLLSINDYVINDFAIFPNPAKDFLNIESTNNTDFSISIYNSVGQEVLKSKKAEQLNISDLPRGFYIVQFETNKSKVSKKLIKQ